MEVIKKETFTSRTLASSPEDDDLTFRVVYADHVPVTEWTVWFVNSFDLAKEVARRQAAADLHPTSRVTDNVIIIEQYHGGEWDAYDPDGKDLTDLAFGGEG